MTARPHHDLLPAGYELVELPRPGRATLTKRPASIWRRELAAVASALGTEAVWHRDVRGDTNALLSLAARGALELARHPTRPNLYRITAYGRRVLSGEAER